MLLAGSAISGGDLSKPACKAQNMGQLWPDAANHDRAAVGRFARCGELQICTRGPWHYGWQPLTVSVEQLRNVKAKPANCTESPENGSTASAATSSDIK